MSWRRESDICHDQSSLIICYGQSFFLFSFFKDGTKGIGEKNCASLHVSKNRDNFQVSGIWTHSAKCPAIKEAISASDCAISKKRKASSGRLIHVSSLTTGSSLQIQQEKVKSQQQTRLPLAWPPKFKNQVFFTPRAQNRFIFLNYFYAVAGRNLEACLAARKSSNRSRRTRVYNVLAYFYADYFDAGRPAGCVINRVLHAYSHVEWVLHGEKRLTLLVLATSGRPDSWIWMTIWGSRRPPQWNKI